MRRIGIILIGAGIIMIIGAAEASDAGIYNLWQAVGGVLAGAAVAETGALLVKLGK